MSNGLAPKAQQKKGLSWRIGRIYPVLRQLLMWSNPFLFALPIGLAGQADPRGMGVPPVSLPSPGFSSGSDTGGTPMPRIRLPGALLAP